MKQDEQVQESVDREQRSRREAMQAVGKVAKYVAPATMLLLSSKVSAFSF